MTLTRYKKLDTSDPARKLHLLVSGFGLQRLVPVDDIVDAIGELPNDHIKRLKVIKYDPNKNISFLLRHQRLGSQLGEYLGDFDSIVVYDFIDRNECFHVLFHEIGHHVYFKHISSQQKKQWVTEIYRSEPSVTKVGSKNACEDFAESYALYKNKPDLLHQFPNKLKFISNLF